MAFLTFYKSGQELGRWQLDGPAVIGRAPDCTIAVHDILLSRHHCRIEQTREGWTAVDLNSKNGTSLAGERIARQGLRDGDMLTMGRTAVRFNTGQLPKDSPGAARMTSHRPADPFEALAGTVSGFDADAAATDAANVAEVQREHNFPTPQPVPKEPEAYADDDVYAMLAEIASSSWDSIYATASRPRRPLPAPPALTGARVAPTPAEPKPAAPARQPPRKPVRPARPAREWSLEVRAAPVSRTSRAMVTQGSTVETSRRTWVGRVASGVGRRLQSVRRWIAPNGAIRLV